MITAVNIEQQIEEAIQTLLEADTYISTNSIDVRLWFDTTEDLVGRQVIVHANSAIPSLTDENGEAQEYEVQCDILSYIHNTEDETPGAETNTLYQTLVGFVEQTTKAGIEAELTRLTVNGKHTSPYAEEYDERFYTKVASFTIYVSAEAPYVVAGAGTATANGSYYVSGTHNDKTAYKHETETMYIYFRTPYWNIGPDLVTANRLYQSSSMADIPPLTGWIVDNGDAPAPTLTV